MSGPLAGTRGIVLTQAWAGSYCSSLLGMLGADVVQVEVRKRPDSWRGDYAAPLAPMLRDIETARNPWNCSALYNSVNLGKRCITLDLGDERGMRAFRRLLEHADFCAENFSPRVMGNFGLAYEQMRAIKPDIILASLSAYGHDGSWANVPGIGGTIEPSSGMSALLGYEGGPPLNSGQMYPDVVAGYNACAAIITALRHRDRTGEGQFIDLSMQEASLAWVGDAFLEYATTGRQRPRMGNRHHTFAPHGVYPAAPADGEGERWIALACESEEQWRALCDLAALGWAEDARFATPADRKANEDALDEAIRGWTAGHDRDVLASRLTEAGVVAAPVLDALEVAADPVLRERRVVVEVEHPEAGRWPQVALPMHFSRTVPEVPPRPAPLQGEHTHEVLAELLDMSADEVDELVRAGVSGGGPPD
ncbi:MAG: CoA transferase [Dehalococcoidia bacterium]|nr:CoA transferase [Dehalococcoidia bacterium]